MSTILPFPGKKCSFFVHGRCGLSPPSRPGGEGVQHCTVLALWERLQDEALSMAEDHRLGEADTMAIMSERLRPAQYPELLCGLYQPRGTDCALDCIFLDGHLCIQALPLCTGACPRFMTRTRKTVEPLYEGTM